MKSYFRSRDSKYRILFNAVELKRLRLLFFLKSSFVSFSLKTRIKYLHNKKFSKKFSNLWRFRNTCIFTMRTNSVFRYFKLSRMRIKLLGSDGKLSGIGKSS